MKVPKLKSPPLPEQIAPSRLVEAFGHCLRQLALGRCQRFRQRRGLGVPELPEQGPFFYPGGPDDPPPERSDGAGRIPSRRREAETAPQRLEEAVSLANQAIQIRQRPDQFGPVGALAGDDREPEPELGQPHGSRAQIDSEKVALQDSAPAAGENLGLPSFQLRQAFQRAEQEGAGADGRVEHGEGAKGRECRRIAVAEATPGLALSTVQPAGQGRREGRVQHAAHQRRRSVEGARGAAQVRRHDAFEHPSQHVWRDSLPGPLGDGEVEPLEELVERIPPERGWDRPPD